MRLLKNCPECYAKLQMTQKNIQVCKVCGYWTRTGTVRLEPLVLYDSIILEE